MLSTYPMITYCKSAHANSAAVPGQHMLPLLLLPLAFPCLQVATAPCTPSPTSLTCLLLSNNETWHFLDISQLQDIASFSSITLEVEPEEEEPRNRRAFISNQTSGGCSMKEEEMTLRSWSQGLTSRATFVLASKHFDKGLCLQVVDGKKYKLNPTKNIKVTIKGNGTEADYLTAGLVVLTTYLVFATTFLLVWYRACSCLLAAPRPLSDKLEETVNSPPALGVSKVTLAQHSQAPPDPDRLCCPMFLTCSILYLIPSLQMTLNSSQQYRSPTSTSTSTFLLTSTFACTSDCLGITTTATTTSAVSNPGPASRCSTTLSATWATSSWEWSSWWPSTSRKRGWKRGGWTS